MERYNFGDLVFVPFPFSDADADKNRWGFVLADSEMHVVVAYCTTNPSITSGAVSLGKIADNKVSNLVAFRWEVIDKSRIITHKGTKHANLRTAGLLPLISKICKIQANGRPWYHEYTEIIQANVLEARSWVDRVNAVQYVHGHRRA